MEDVIWAGPESSAHSRCDPGTMHTLMHAVPEGARTCLLIDLQIGREVQSLKRREIQGERRRKKHKDLGKRSRGGEGKAQTPQTSLEEGNFPAGLSLVSE